MNVFPVIKKTTALQPNLTISKPVFLLRAPNAIPPVRAGVRQISGNTMPAIFPSIPESIKENGINVPIVIPVIRIRCLAVPIATSTHNLRWTVSTKE